MTAIALAAVVVLCSILKSTPFQKIQPTTRYLPPIRRIVAGLSSFSALWMLTSPALACTVPGVGGWKSLDDPQDSP